MVKMVKKKRSTLQILILITAIAYSFWVILYLIGFFFYSDFLTKMNTGFYVSIGFIAAGLILISLIFALIEKLQRDPFILFSVFILGGRIIGFTAAYLFPGFSRNSFFLLPFGNADFFIFYFLIIGFFTFLRKSVLIREKNGFKALSLLALLLFACPVFFNLLGKSLTFLAVYSLVYTLLPVAALLAAPYYTNLASVKLIIVSVVMAVVFDMLIYLQFTDWTIPDNLNYLLLPYSFLIFTAGVIRRAKETANG
ncbi:MAG: hypothetical protein DRP57_05955 [Spirochaetes bacterium]|nr:MAG: hypothetical protein DRP57_05955 [Spirochaetota bacterium]